MTNGGDYLFINRGLHNAAVGRFSGSLFSGKGGDQQTLLRSIQDTFKEGDIVMGEVFLPPISLLQRCHQKALTPCWNSMVLVEK